MLSYENPAGDFQGITYDNSDILKAAGEFPLPAASKGGRMPDDYLRRFSLAIRER